MNKAELNFVQEMARRQLVGWCHRTLVDLPAIPPPSTITDPENIKGSPIYIGHAKKMGWLSADGKRVLAKGFNTAAAFLRR